MGTKPFKVMDWLCSIRDEHYESLQDKALEDDLQDISSIAETSLSKIRAFKSNNKTVQMYY